MRRCDDDGEVEKLGEVEGRRVVRTGSDDDATVDHEKCGEGGEQEESRPVLGHEMLCDRPRNAREELRESGEESLLQFFS